MDNQISENQYNEAVKLHHEIISNGTIAAQALYEMCKNLKRMRDEQLYKHLGYEDFETYCVDKANIKKRQAYNYIKTVEELGNNFLQSNTNIGITKLELLTHVPALDRDEFMDNNNVTEMSVSELEKQIEKLKQDNYMKGEQISLLENEQAKGKDDSEALKKLKIEAEKLKQENEELKNRPIEVAVSEPDKDYLKKLEDEIIKIKEQSDLKLKKAVKAEQKKSDDAIKTAIKEKQAEFEAKISEYENAIAKQNENLSEAVKKQMELDERLKNAKKDNSAKFRIYFDQLNNVIENCCDALAEIDDLNTQKKFANALKTVGENLFEETEKYI